LTALVSEQDFLGNMHTILNSAKANNIYLRLIGSIAIRMHSESARAQVIPRALTDIDLVGYSKQCAEIMTLFQRLGYTGDEDFNSLHGSERLLFFGKDGLRIDVFLDVLSMSHKLDLQGRLELDYPTLPLTDLLMTKLQIAELNEKDVKDMICLLHDHELAESDLPEKINSKYVAELCSEDWGIYKTFNLNLNRILAYLDKLCENDQMRDHIRNQCNSLLQKIEAAPKSMKWKMRARVGEKKRWYQLPEE
jgi:hypothetical protein